MLNNTATEAKYNITVPISNIGICGDIGGQACFAETSLRFEVVGVGPTNSIDIQGRLRNSPNWYVIATIPGAVSGTIDISTYDFIRYNTTVLDGSGVMYASGYLFSKNINTVVKNSSGVELDINPNGSLDVVDGLSAGGVFGAIAMPLANTAYEAMAGATSLVQRKSILIVVMTSGIYWGTDATLSIANGMPTALGQQLSFACDPMGNFKVFLVSSAINGAFRIVEMP